MSFLITLVGEDVQFNCKAKQTILDAALENAITLSYGCKSGLCGSCKGSIISGQIEYPDGQPDGINEGEVEANEALFCKAVPLSNLSVEVKILEPELDLEIKKLPVKVKKIEHLSEDVIQLILQLPSVESFNFKAGQWIYFLLKDGKKRAFSIANKVNDKNELELQIRHALGGVFTDFVFDKLIPGALLQIEGPHGTFYYHQDENPLLLVAGGTGFAPIKGIIEEILEIDPQQKIHLFWGSRTKKDLYMEQLIQNWVQDNGINYTPVLSEPDIKDEWTGETGFVHQAVLQDYPHLSNFSIYMAGPPQMIQSCKESFINAGLKQDNLYYDSFDYSTDVLDAMNTTEANNG